MFDIIISYRDLDDEEIYNFTLNRDDSLFRDGRKVYKCVQQLLDERQINLSQIMISVDDGVYEDYGSSYDLYTSTNFYKLIIQRYKESSRWDARSTERNDQIVEMFELLDLDEQRECLKSLIDCMTI